MKLLLTIAVVILTSGLLAAQQFGVGYHYAYGEYQPINRMVESVNTLRMLNYEPLSESSYFSGITMNLSSKRGKWLYSIAYTGKKAQLSATSLDTINTRVSEVSLGLSSFDFEAGYMVKNWFVPGCAFSISVAHGRVFEYFLRKPAVGDGQEYLNILYPGVNVYIKSYIKSRNNCNMSLLIKPYVHFSLARPNFRRLYYALLDSPPIVDDEFRGPLHHVGVSITLNFGCLDMVKKAVNVYADDIPQPPPADDASSEHEAHP